MVQLPLTKIKKNCLLTLSYNFHLWLLLACVIGLSGCIHPASTIVRYGAPGSRDQLDFSNLSQNLEANTFFQAKKVNSLCKRDRPLKILIWGQSISEQFRSEELEDFLQQQWSGCAIEVENRSRGGCAAQCLAGEIPWAAGKATEAIDYFERDVLPLQPDFVIFHVYGSHLAYSKLMQQFATQTHAQVLLLTDHISVQPESQVWSNTMAWTHLPRIAAAHHFPLADVRLVWRQYLYETGMPAESLLRDQVHLNELGVDLYMYIIEAMMTPPSVLVDANRSAERWAW